MSNKWGLLTLTALLVADLAGGAPAESPASAYRRGDYKEAIKLVKPQAKSGIIAAEIMLGHMYMKGEGTEANVPEGLTWIRKAAAQGAPIACYELGLFSLTGIGGPVDGRAALDWFRKSAHGGNADAAFHLAEIYHQGVFVGRDDVLSLAWIDAALHYLGRFADDGQRSRYRAFRDALSSEMSGEQIAAATRLLSPDGPVMEGRLRNGDALAEVGLKEYPMGLRHLGRGGTCFILMLVHDDGTVGERQIEISSGYEELDKIALRLLADAQLEPRHVDDQPVESWQRISWKWSQDVGSGLSFQELNALPRAH